MGKDLDLLCAGYPSLDRIVKLESDCRVGATALIRNADYHTPRFGGCSVNVAALGARLGLRTGLVARVGEDYGASGLKGFLERCGVCTDAVTQVPGEQTSGALMILNPSGEHVTLFYPGAMKAGRRAPVRADLVRRARYGVVTVGEPEDNRQFAEACVREGVPLVFGMKCDFAAFPPETLRYLLEHSAYLFMNRAEREEMERRLGYESITGLLGGEARCIAVTKGAAGSELYYRTGGGLCRAEVPAARARRVRDTTGVGDSYLAGFLFGLLRGHDCAGCGRMGSVLASLNVEEDGCLGRVPSAGEAAGRYQITYGEEWI